MATIKVKQIKSKSGSNVRQCNTLRALGFTKMHQVLEITDNAQTRGMINKVNHLVQIL